jgi:hypothetical protein
MVARTMLFIREPLKNSVHSVFSVPSVVNSLSVSTTENTESIEKKMNWIINQRFLRSPRHWIFYRRGLGHKCLFEMRAVC